MTTNCKCCGHPEDEHLKGNQCFKFTLIEPNPIYKNVVKVDICDCKKFVLNNQ